MDLDQVDLERGGDYFVRSEGAIVTVPAATGFNWRQVVSAIKDPFYFAALVWPASASLMAWKVDLVHQGWIRHNGLTAADEVPRLIMLMERYFDGIEYDLQSRLGEDAGELWRQRKWRKLLGYITSLPADTQMNYLLSQDEEYLEHAMRAQEKNRTGGSATAPGPSMAEWNLTVSLLAQVVDAVNRNTEVTKAAAGGKPSQVRPVPRPTTAAERIGNRIQREAHEEMSAILLRNRPDRSGGKMNGSPSPAE